MIVTWTHIVRARVPWPAKAHRINLARTTRELAWLGVAPCREAWLISYRGEVLGLLTRDDSGWGWFELLHIADGMGPWSGCSRSEALTAMQNKVYEVQLDSVPGKTLVPSPIHRH